MAHIHHQPGQHDHTISAFIIRLDGPEPTVMLHAHRKLGKILQFGGHVELHEDPWTALLRELTEESGYEPSQLKVLQPRERFEYSIPDCVQHPLPFYFNTHRYKKDEAHFHTDSAYAVVAREAPARAIADGESPDLRLLTERQLRLVSEEDMYEATRQSALYVFEHLLANSAAVNVTDFH